MGSVGFLLDFEFCMAVLGFGIGSIGLVAPLRIKRPDFQPEKSNMGPVSTDFHEFYDFPKRCRGFLARYFFDDFPGSARILDFVFF